MKWGEKKQVNSYGLLWYVVLFNGVPCGHVYIYIYNISFIYIYIYITYYMLCRYIYIYIMTVCVHARVYIQWNIHLIYV
jgi:hypothetical protein